MDSKISFYKFITTIAILVCFIGEAFLISSDTISMGVKITLGMIIVIFVYVINMIYFHKVSSLTCPKCRKPVMTKANFPDDSLIGLKSYEKCYFCGYDFEK